jgi:hypothetical protein
MGAFYRRAKSVSSWLGRWETSELAVTCLESLAKWERTRYEDNAKAPEEVAKAIDWLALQSFFQQPYWSRVWIVQEMSFGQNLTILCGDAPEISLEQVMATIQACERFDSLLYCLLFTEVPGYCLSTRVISALTRDLTNCT